MQRAIQKYGILILGILVLSGCAAFFNGYGTNVSDQIAQNNFEAFQIDPGMNYYASGPNDAYPIVIMGLKKRYLLDNDLWRPIPPDPQLFKDLVKRMQFEAQAINQVQRGFVLKSPEGQDVGVCYCRITAWVNVKMGEGNKVIVYTPDSEENSYTPADGGDR
ncbi:MAG: hypothetical protein NT140_02165 [Deltaproteobacteria bacterium]|nr:hypothetical protein [Deltaproteobacteria bacterium]